MSHIYYNELWLVTRNDLEKLLKFERKLQESAPLRKKVMLNTALSIYVRYHNIVKRLIMCYDQMVQTQKRNLIKKVLNCAIGRMLECKREVTCQNYLDYQWPDDILYQMKFTWDDLELLATACGRERLEERKKFVQDLIEKVERAKIKEPSLSQTQVDSTTEFEEEIVKTRITRRKRAVQPTKVEMPRESPEEIAAREMKAVVKKAMFTAILLIQCHERARRSRVRGEDAKRIFEYKEKVAYGDIIPKMIDRAEYIESAKIIQCAWRRYIARKDIRKKIARLEEALGMTIPSWQCRKVFTRDEENFKRRRAIIPVFTEQTEKTICDKRARLLKIKGPGLMEDITDEIHEWFVIWYDAVGHYDVFPVAKLGGSVLIVTGQTSTPHEYLTENLEKEMKEKVRKKEAPKPEAKSTPIKLTVSEKGKMPQTQALSCLMEANADFVQNWSLRDESSNPEQKEYLDLIVEKLSYELQLEMRKIADELLRAELELLNKALSKDHAYDKKKFVIPTMNGKEKKKGAQPIRKTKEKKSVMDDVPVEDLFYELLQAGVIREYPIVFLRDWVGDFSYGNYEALLESRDCKHRLGEVKQLVFEYCVLPLISKETHQIAPLVRSVCICGLPRAGKTFLANAICSEVGALLLDVSPSVLVDKFTDKKEQKRFINMVSRVARVYAPSVIFLDPGEGPWLKKVPPEKRHLQPKRFTKQFVKLIKSIAPGDQVLFLSLSEQPGNATRSFFKVHNRFIMIPTTDYNTLYMYYKDLLMKYHGIDRNIDVSCLAKMSIGVPLSFIKGAMEKVLSLQRRITLKHNPLSPTEILNEVLMYDHPAEKTLEEFHKVEKRVLRRKMKTRAAAPE
ncbi:IQ and AAA domain-containing protein ENSP00000340148 [Harpegnathos saltator]|uniref:IQ and AAA domain-containing protein ENSP00000340148 n=1 Tax=Harpegnathos saltator TaxID=610380 RepID=E2BYZ9_HARSA|nr:IQ and AAA domain-containing protein ENSP00000340148 [Harpegnathos saltator]